MQMHTNKMALARSSKNNLKKLAVPVVKSNHFLVLSDYVLSDTTKIHWLLYTLRCCICCYFYAIYFANFFFWIILNCSVLGFSRGIAQAPFFQPIAIFRELRSSTNFVYNLQSSWEGRCLYTDTNDATLVTFQ